MENDRAEAKAQKEGFVYLATSPLLHAVKIGSWKGAAEGIRTRYMTPYGPLVHVNAQWVADCRATERLLHTKFANKNVGGELFDKSCFACYAREIMLQGPGA